MEPDMVFPVAMAIRLFLWDDPESLVGYIITVALCISETQASKVRIF
jgi:hypothetical protein